VALETGGLIEIEDYNEIALEVNRLFSDNTSSLIYNSSNKLADEVIAGGDTSPLYIVNLDTPMDSVDDFIVVTLDNETLIRDDDYTVLSTSQVRISSAVPDTTQIQVFNRTTHRYGWGQQASVYPATEGDIVRSDEQTLQAYLEANVNNLIDKVNIMETRTTGPTSLSRVASGEIIDHQDKATILTTIDNDIDSGTQYWDNDVATITRSVIAFDRTDPWTTKLTGIARYTWDNYNEMRYFFNSGNAIRISLEMTGDDSNQGYANWSQVIEDIGTVVLNYEQTTQTGVNGTGVNIGAYELTGGYQTVFTSGSPSAPKNIEGGFEEYASYDSLQAVFSARILEDAPATGQISIDVRVELDDTEFDQYVEGTTSFLAGYTLADDVTNNTAIFSVTDFTPAVTGLVDWIVDGTSITPAQDGFTWSDVGADGDSVEDGFEFVNGDMKMIVECTILNPGCIFEIDTSTTNYVAGGEPFSATPSLRVGDAGSPAGDVGQIEFRFAATPGRLAPPEVENFLMRVNDIDQAISGRQEQITVTAFDAEGNSVTPTLTGGSNLTIVDNVATSNTNFSSNASNASNSLLISVTVPVNRVIVKYGSIRNNGGGAVWISEVYYDTISL